MGIRRDEYERELFDRDFYPTPPEVIEMMLEGLDLDGKIVLEPSAGKGNIAKELQKRGAKVIFCETNNQLAQLSAEFGDMIAEDFTTVNQTQVSHVDYIIMNPPFSADETHIIHAFNIMPDTCKIVALCNWNTLSNPYSKSRKELATLIGMYGRIENLGAAFKDSERVTSVDVGLVRLHKYENMTDESMHDYFTDEDDEQEIQQNGLMSYNAVREVVQRYVTAVKLYDSVLDTAVQMNELVKHVPLSCSDDNKKDLVFTCTRDNVAYSRERFKNELQLKSWRWIFDKMNLDKYVTSEVMKDINKYIESQKSLKFTMKNIYKMFEVLIGTSSQYMDKSLVSVFDNITRTAYDNRWNVEGWKTNSDYLLNRKFIKSHAISIASMSGVMEVRYGSRNEEMEDLLKAICYVEGVDFNKMISLGDRVSQRIYLKKDGNYIQDSSKDWKYLTNFVDQKEADQFLAKHPEEGYELEYPPKWGELFDWGFFEVRAYLKGTCHFKFKSEDVWMRFNQNIARIKGFPLPQRTAQPKPRKKRTKTAA